ncbi:MAG: hypothetical protein ABIH23_18950 [bacterium]
MTTLKDTLEIEMPQIKADCPVDTYESLRAALAAIPETEEALAQTIWAYIVEIRGYADANGIMLSAKDVRKLAASLAEMGVVPPVCTCGKDNPEQGGVGHGAFCPCNPNRASVQLTKTRNIDAIAAILQSEEAITIAPLTESQANDLAYLLEAKP